MLTITAYLRPYFPRQWQPRHCELFLWLKVVAGIIASACGLKGYHRNQEEFHLCHQLHNSASHLAFLSGIIIVSMVIVENLKTKLVFTYIQGFRVRTCIAFKWRTGQSGQLEDMSLLPYDCSRYHLAIHTAALSCLHASSVHVGVCQREWSKIGVFIFTNSTTRPGSRKGRDQISLTSQ